MSALTVLRTPGLVPYRDALALQERLQAERIAAVRPDLRPDVRSDVRGHRETNASPTRVREQDLLWLLEHPPVFTMGVRADPSHVVWDAAQRERHGVELVTTDRGGDVTWHGPGQVVGYVIAHLGGQGLKVGDFVRGLESTLILALKDFDIVAHRKEGYPGVWVRGPFDVEAKIAQIGVRIRHDVSMHGFALNVSNNPLFFSGIVPCGISGYGVTRMAALLLDAPPMAIVKDALAHRFAEVFGYAPVETVSEA